MERREYIYKIGAILFPLGSFLFVLFSKFIHLGYWADEAFTLKYFVFCSPKKTVTFYPYPNNHVFYSLLLNLYTQIVGIRTPISAIYHPFALRITGIIIMLLILYFLFRLFLSISDVETSLFSLVFILTTIPFLNFITQLRGYGLSMLFLLLIIFHSFKFIKEERKLHLVLAGLYTTLLIYTVPSNLYFALAILTFFIGDIVRKWRKTHRISLSSSLLLFIAVSLGISLSALLYLPIIDKVIHNPFVRSFGPFYLPTLTNRMPVVFFKFLSMRFLLVPLLALPFLKKDILKREPFTSWIFALSITVLLLPFIFSFIRGDRPYERTFIPLIPAFAIFFTILFHLFTKILKKGKSLFLFIFSLYLTLTFIFEVKRIDRYLLRALEKGIRPQNIYYNFYHYHFEPLKVTLELKELTKNNLKYVYLHKGPGALGDFYLKAFGMKGVPKTLYPFFRNKKKFYAVTINPPKFLEFVKNHFRGYRVERIGKKDRYHRIYLLERQ